jgi:hypothetical protein
MTVIVSVKINDGVVLAVDSAGSMESGQVYEHANKITNLCAGVPVGAMSTGSGGIGNESIETLLKDLRRRFAGLSETRSPILYHGAGRTAAAEFIFEEKASVCTASTNIQMRVCGFSANHPLAEIWEVNLTQDACPPPRCIMGEDDFGVLWDGQYEALNRLVLGLGFDVGTALVKHGIPAEKARELQTNLLKDLYVSWPFPRCRSRIPKSA